MLFFHNLTKETSKEIKGLRVTNIRTQGSGVHLLRIENLHWQLGEKSTQEW
jgi:hypothetical protein